MKKILNWKFSLSVKIVLCLFITIFSTGCNSEEDIVKEDPYGGGKEPYGIKFIATPPSPDRAYPGDEVIYKTKGLSQWINEDGTAEFEFFISNEKAEIVMATDSTITVKVPESLSTGIAHILLKEQIFYGPKLTVLGNVSVDKGYTITSGLTGTIYDYLEHYDTTTKNHYHWVGDFHVYNDSKNSWVSCIAWVNSSGTIAMGWNGTYYKIDSRQGIGYDYSNPNSGESSLDYYAKSISYFNNDKSGTAPNVLISGKFTQYKPVGREDGISVNNMMKVQHSIGMMFNNVQLPTSKTGETRSVRITSFNGGTKEPPVATFITSDDKVIAVGNITQYCKINIEQSFADELVYEFTPVRSVLRMNSIGELDETYRMEKSGVEGFIQDTYMDEKEGIVIVGNFKTFDGITTPNIVRLDKNGEIDAQFLQNIGTGANGAITKIRYNKNRRKAMVVGEFTDFNGVECQGIIMLNNDGTVDETFSPRRIEGGNPNFACILNNHDIVVISGLFKKYDGVSRQGFLMLTLDGEAMQKFNVPGMFLGELNHVIETKTSTNDNGLLLLGNFRRFNGEPAYNAIKIEVDFD
ncbi:DUF5124 domain-containing protein [Dysgonomonas sp. GY75]|uniref:DUF5124 domain-containing protein n=1 Tax=Dysgonomonas sp. GY75 TaxID=2780419 RepID=UPI001884752D|nr:DUF5124 domain-containing protein [Dysgonomonas sp. GY75]MBF0648219.1 DUF5124 domain-containing protein [Dysgonomonas sp. GY75]